MKQTDETKEKESSRGRGRGAEAEREQEREQERKGEGWLRNLVARVPQKQDKKRTGSRFVSLLVYLFLTPRSSKLVRHIPVEPNPQYDCCRDCKTHKDHHHSNQPASHCSNLTHVTG